MWNIFRIEWEVNCQEDKANANKDEDEDFIDGRPLLRESSVK